MSSALHLRSLRNERVPTPALTRNRVGTLKIPTARDAPNDSLGYFEVWPANNRQHMIASRGGARRVGLQPVNNLTRDPEALSCKPALLINLETYISDSLAQLTIKYPDRHVTMANTKRNTAVRDDVHSWQMKHDQMKSENDSREVGAVASSHALTLFDDNYMSIGNIAAVQKYASVARQVALLSLPRQCGAQEIFRRERCCIFQEAAVLFSGGFKTYRLALQWITDEYDAYIASIVSTWTRMHQRIDDLVAELQHTNELLNMERTNRADEAKASEAALALKDATLHDATAALEESKRAIAVLQRTLDKNIEALKDSDDAKTILARKGMKVEADLMVLKESIKISPSDMDKVNLNVTRQMEKYHRLTDQYEELMKENVMLKAHAELLHKDLSTKKKVTVTTPEPLSKRSGPQAKKVPEFNAAPLLSQIESRRKYIPAVSLPTDSVCPIPPDLLVAPRVRNMSIPTDKIRVVVRAFFTAILKNIKADLEEPLWEVFMFSVKDNIPGPNAIEVCHNILHDVAGNPEFDFFLELLFERAHPTVMIERAALVEEIRKKSDAAESRADVEAVIKATLPFVETECMNALLEIVRFFMPEDSSSVDILLAEESAFVTGLYAAYNVARKHVTTDIVDNLIEIVDISSFPTMANIQTTFTKVLPDFSSAQMESMLDFVLLGGPKVPLNLVVHRIQALAIVKKM